MREYRVRNDQIHDGSLVLINSKYEYQATASADLTAIGSVENGVTLDRQAALALSKLLAKIRGEQKIAAVSGWRSRQEQETIWKDSLQEHGLAFTKKFVARPGHSEHQTGLAIDLGLNTEKIDFLCPDFPDEGIGRVFRENAADFGFIERYPAGKEKLTGIGHEPWHFRYVGACHAHIMREKGWTLEEYVEAVKEYPIGERALSYHNQDVKVRICYLPASKKRSTRFEMDRKAALFLSGNNIDGFIITEWREWNGNAETLRRTGYF